MTFPAVANWKFRKRIILCPDCFTGSNDPDELIIRAFRAYEGEGEEARKINAQMFTHALKTWGDKFTQAEVDDIFGEFEVDDDGFIAAKVWMYYYRQTM